MCPPPPYFGLEVFEVETLGLDFGTDPGDFGCSGKARQSRAFSELFCSEFSSVGGEVAPQGGWMASLALGEQVAPL